MRSLTLTLQPSNVVGWLIGGLFLAAPTVHAASASYNGSATLTFIINSIANTTQPGNLSNLSAQATFESAGSPTSFVFSSGDGSAYSPTPNGGPTPLTVGDRFSYTFDALGSVDNGSVDASHTGWYGLSFTSLTGDSYQIGVTLDYTLAANAQGPQFAASQVQLDYFDANDNVAPGSDRLLASSDFLPSNSLSGSSGVLTLLVSGANPNALLADVAISGNLEATTVPLPAMAWPFFACVVAGYRLARRHHAPMVASA